MADQQVLSTADLARMLSWSTKRVRRWLQREGVGFKVGDRFYVTPTMLRDTWPEIYWQLYPELSWENRYDDEG